MARGTKEENSPGFDQWLIASSSTARSESNAECVSLAPTVFELDDEELCVVIDPKGAKTKRILDAARACPTDAITLIDDSGEQVWP